MQLSPNFSLEEFTISQEAVRKGIDNSVTDEWVMANLQMLAEELEKVRLVLKNPMIVTSAYRCLELNHALRGVTNSQHIYGQACDFICPKAGTPYEICNMILKNPHIEFDQLIHEFGRWVHISFAGGNGRREILTICKPRAGYRRGLFKC